ncbi:MAG: signal peptidase II [Acholeplasmataceae bacterium]
MILGYILITILVILDYGLKKIFSTIYLLDQTELIIKGVLRLGHIRNFGASFGMLEGFHLLFFFITIIALVIFGYFFSKSDFKNKKVYSIAFTFLIAGTFGNAIDRLFYGYVIDYIQVPFLPIVGNTFFNLADALLNVGVVLLIIDILFLESKRNEKNETN